MKRWRLLEKKRNSEKLTKKHLDFDREVLQMNIRYIIKDELMRIKYISL